MVRALCSHSAAHRLPSSCNATNTVLPAIWTSRGPAELTRKRNHRTTPYSGHHSNIFTSFHCLMCVCGTITARGEGVQNKQDRVRDCCWEPRDEDGRVHTPVANAFREPDNSGFPPGLCLVMWPQVPGPEGAEPEALRMGPEGVLMGGTHLRQGQPLSWAVQRAGPLERSMDRGGHRLLLISAPIAPSRAMGQWVVASCGPSPVRGTSPPYWLTQRATHRHGQSSL